MISRENLEWNYFGVNIKILQNFILCEKISRYNHLYSIATFPVLPIPKV
jgi:hypothetical protein